MFLGDGRRRAPFMFLGDGRRVHVQSGHHFLGCQSKRQAFAPNIQLSYVGPRAGTVKQPNFQLGSGQVINLTLAAFRWEIRSRPATTGTLTEWHRHCQAAQLSARVRSANRPDPTFHFNCGVCTGVASWPPPSKPTFSSGQVR